MTQAQAPVTFVRPPDAPVFYPTEEEFSSPLLYIQSIKAEAEKFGICKIVPPKSFKPFFAVNKDTFKFKARFQRLSDLDGFSRSRHSFVCMLRRFWTDQGWPSDLPVPTIGDRYIDWYDLYISVHRLGGYKAVCASADGWTTLVRQLGISATYTNASKELKALFDKNLLPYDEFRASVEIYLGKDRDSSRNIPINKSSGCRRMKKETANCSPVPNMEESDLNTSGHGSSVDDVLQERDSPNKETKTEKKEDNRKIRVRRSQSNVCYSEVVCEICKETDEFDNLKFCEKCETTYHLRCIPPSIRKDKTKLWLCPKCMKETYDGLRACHTFGFEHTNTLYSIEEFQKNANEFKRKHFGAVNVGLHIVEAEFWRLLGDSNDETVVEYGADLQRGEQGSSGFPTETDRPFLRESEKEYIDHPWNLNKLPDNELSILRHITVQISGMKVPWMYVGMVFSAFCWHTEDHWSASINYVHHGEPKTWYGVPGASAEAFETAFKQLVPILMESNPDLLHQLVTHMNPTILQSCGIPVYRVDQRAGEFIVTFPRAYHSGFNQGFNFAEAVNFCLSDWIPHGRLSIAHYSNCKRDLVFSHDELICCMADQASQLHHTIAKACHSDFVHMVGEESANRQNLIDLGIVLDDEPTLFEFMDDHERACSSCHTTLFLSAVQCACSERLACAKHASRLCNCDISNQRLLYRYTIDDLNHLLSRLLKRAEDAVEHKPVIPTGSVCQKRIPHAQDGRFAIKKQKVTPQDSGPMDFFADSDITGSSNSELKAVMRMAGDLVSPQTLTRTREATDAPSIQKRWKITDAESLVTSLLAFPGTGKEVSLVREYQRKYYALQGDIRAVLLIKPEDQNAETVRRLYDQARSTNIETDDLPELMKVVQQTEFRERVVAALNDPRSGIQTLAEVLQSVDEMLVRSDYMQSMVALLTSLIDEGRNLEIDAENIAMHGGTVPLSDAKALVERADAYPIDLKHVDDIRDGIETIEKLIGLLEECKNIVLCQQDTGQRLHYQRVRAVLDDQDLKLYHSHGASEILKVSSRTTAFLKELRKLFFGFAGGTSAGQLMEVLCPRRIKKLPNSTVPVGGRGKKKPEEADPSVEPVEFKSGGLAEEPLDGKTHPFDLELDKNYEFSDLRILFERACSNEQTHFERMRETNCLKSAIDSDLRDECATLRKDLRWCVCGRQQLGMMIQCDSCFDWFHVSCTRMAEFIHTEGIAEFGLINQLVESIQFMCDFCQRGVRPPLEGLTRLLVDYDDVQKFFCVPEMDLLNLVIARAEKWRRSATNIVLQLPIVVHEINSKCSTDAQTTERIRLRLRDTLLAILLEGNLLEVKVPEWMFLYDFVHENFRKDRGDDTREVRQMTLPIRSGRLPLGVDMISPLFRNLSKSFRTVPNHFNGAQSLDFPPLTEPSVAINGEQRRGAKRGRKRLIRKDELYAPPQVIAASAPALEDSSPDSVVVKRTRRRGRMELPPRLPEPAMVRPRRSTAKAASYSADSSSDNAMEICSSCHQSFPVESLLSLIIDGQIVPMCSSCTPARKGTLRRQKSVSLSTSDTDNNKPTVSPRRQRALS